MTAADKLTQVTRHANTVDDLAAEGRNYGDDYMAALETSAADVPDLVGALQAVLAKHEPIDALLVAGRYQEHKVQVCTGCGTDDGNWQRWPCPTVRAIEEAL